MLAVLNSNQDDVQWVTIIQKLLGFSLYITIHSRYEYG